jgi:hypothetical protein
MSSENSTFASLLLNAKIVKSDRRFIQIGHPDAPDFADSDIAFFKTYAIQTKGYVVTLRAAEAGGQLFLKWVHVMPDESARTLEIGIKEEGKAFHGIS